MTILSVFGRYSKFIAAIIGVATEAINVGILPQSAHNDVSIVISILTALGVYGVTNTPKADPLADRVDSIEAQQASLAELQDSFAAGTTAAVTQALAPIAVPEAHVAVPVEAADRHYGNSGPSGLWPTEPPAQLQALAAS